MLSEKYLESRSGSRASRPSVPEQSRGEPSNENFNTDFALSKTDGAK